MQAQSELEQLADSLEPPNLSWLSIAIAVVVFLASIVLARLARRAIRRLSSRVDFGSPAVFASAARISSWVIIFLGLVGSLRVLGIDFVPLMAGLGIAAVVVAVALRPFLHDRGLRPRLSRNRSRGRGLAATSHLQAELTL